MVDGTSKVYPRTLYLESYVIKGRPVKSVVTVNKGSKSSNGVVTPVRLVTAVRLVTLVRAVTAVRLVRAVAAVKCILGRYI